MIIIYVMNSLFAQTFVTVFIALIKIFIIAFIAGFLVRKKIISEETINGISRLVVIIFLPVLIFSTITTEFNPDIQSWWAIIPLGAIGVSAMGILISWLFFIRNSREKKYLFPLSAMQNAVYLVLPIGEFLYKDRFSEFSLVCFLVVLGMSPFMWTVGKVLLTGEHSENHGFRKILTPPFVANVLSIGLVLSGLNGFIPGFISGTAEFIGRATVPLATFILGASIATSIRSIPPFFDTLRVLGVKFVFLPVITILLLMFFQTGEQYPLLSDVLVIQSSSAPATAHILQLRTYGGRIKEASGIIFTAYLICMLAIPFWLTVWKFVS